MSGLDELAARRDEPAVAAAMDRIGDTVGRVLAAAALLLDPELIVIGGDLPRAVPAIVDRAAEVVAAERVPPGHDVAGNGSRADRGPVVRAARLGDDDGARGAVAALYRQSPLLAGYSNLDGSTE